MNTTFDFIKNFSPPEEKGEESSSVEVPLHPKKKMPGLHLTDIELLEGIRYALRTNSQGASDFLMACGAAWRKAFPQNPFPDFSEIEKAIADGAWEISLQELLEAGLTWDALDFMPRGIATVAVHGKELPARTDDLRQVLTGLQGMTEEELAGLEVVQKLAARFGGSVMNIERSE